MDWIAPRRRRPGALALAVLALLASGGCAAGGDRPPAEAAEAAAVEVELTEWELRLSPAEVRAGPVTFRIANTGTLQHSVAVEGNGIQELSDHLAPGEEATLVVDLQPGAYRVYCPVKESGDHDRLGMNAPLVVR